MARREAAIEGSKRFAKEFMKKYGIPTADFKSFTESSKAIEYIRGKEPRLSLRRMVWLPEKGLWWQALWKKRKGRIDAMEEKVFGDAGREIVIEEFLSGQEMSLMAFMDGKMVKPMVVAQDHKPVFDHDQRPNTGGMGAYSPVPQIPEEVIREAVETILLPVQKAFQEEGIEYKGVLYAGLMITASGPKVIEFNARFGDPEQKRYCPDLKRIWWKSWNRSSMASSRNRTSCGVIKLLFACILASGVIRDRIKKELPIQGLDKPAADTVIFHSGTVLSGEEWLTAGGRVLGVTAWVSRFKKHKRGLMSGLNKFRLTMFITGQILQRKLCKLITGLLELNQQFFICMENNKNEPLGQAR